jgi:putative hemolysin
LEELVGDLADEDDKAEVPLIEKRGPGLWRVSGAAPLDKLEKETGVPLPADNYDTFAGFVFTLLGRVPDDGEHCELEYAVPETEDANAGGAGIHITVTDVKEHRLVSALVWMV